MANRFATQEEVQEAEQVQRYRPEKLGRILKSLGYMTSAQLDLALVGYLSVPKLVISEAVLKRAVAARSILATTPALAEWCAEAKVLPISYSSSELEIVSQEFRDEWIEDLQKNRGIFCRIRLCDAETFRVLEEAINPSGSSSSSVQISAPSSPDQKIAGSDPYTSVFRDLLLVARSRKASDIHIQPVREGIAIRLRVHGDMVLWKTLSKEHQRGLTNEVKRITGLPLSVSGIPKDSRVTFEEWKLDLRANLIPSHFGEKIVLRLLDRAKTFSLGGVGLERSVEQDLRKALQSSNGVIIVSGPTGSGKTHTLLSLLAEVDRGSKNVITLEDPIEYLMDGLTQVQISPKVSFASALRSVLRQDPDVILVGEIRDEETADLCLKAASTGHLVLSTLHANGAVEVIDRFLGLGADRHILGSVLRFVSAQRLLPKLCEKCSTEISIEEASQILDLTVSQDGNPRFRRRNQDGCTECDLGRSGMIPVLEYLKPAQLRSLVTSEKQADLKPTPSLKDAAFELSMKGAIDVEDVLSVA